MRRLLAVYGIGLALCAGLWLYGTLSLGVPGFLHWPGDRAITDTAPQFDRQHLRTDLAKAGMALGDPAHVRIFKAERRLEVWLQPADGPYRLFRSYAICTYSGDLGPKLKEGDHQAPEGFYRVAAKQLNPHSRHHLAFNLGFPNAYDRQLGRTGSALMVHGGCSSVGCYAMTDASIDEIYAMVEAAIGQGQDEVDVAIFPFVMSDEALGRAQPAAWAPFWQNLKQGFDLFETAHLPPAVAACNGEYRFGADATGPDCVRISGWV